MPSLTSRYTRLPRSSQRLLLLVFALFGGYLLLTVSRTSPGAIWDASSFSDRRSSGTGDILSGNAGSERGLVPWIRRTFFRPSKPSWLQDTEHLPAAYLSHKGPNLSRLNRTAPRRTQRGSSRVVIPNTNPPEYELGPLPTIEEAYAKLTPKLKDIKEMFQQIPREHELWSPIFPPFLSKEVAERYQHLRAEWDDDLGKWVEVERRWMLVTVCRQVAGMLADWFAMWTVLADFLGPESLVISLLEGGSDDGSGEILKHAMVDHLLYIGVPPANIYVRTLLPPINWEGHHRIELLADMRNAGMKPFYDSLPAGLSPDGIPWTGVVFYNDVYLGGSHILELMHQHMMQDADMTCGWDHAGRWFYDGWVGRDMSGDLYSPFPVKEEDKDAPAKLFLSSPRTRERHNRLLPYQVFAAWNGVALMRPDPFYPPYNVRFRRGALTGLPPDHPHEAILDDKYECQASESGFISWDFWKYGFGRIAVVPGVHACYGKDDAKLRGWLEWPDADKTGPMKEAIDWEDEPPRKVRCHDWPDKIGKGYWAWDTVRWVDPPALVIPEGVTEAPHAAHEEEEPKRRLPPQYEGREEQAPVQVRDTKEEAEPAEPSRSARAEDVMM